MTTAGGPIVTGVFQSEAVAQQAITDLQQAGFDNKQIKYSVHRSGGGIAGALVGMGISNEESDFYNREFEAGRTIVTVEANGKSQAAQDILQRNGAYDASHPPKQTPGGTTGGSRPEEERVELREEVLQVEKQPVQGGEVSVHKDVITEQKTIDVPVTREEIVIERKPVSGQRPEDNRPIGEGESIRIPVSEEQVNITKQQAVTDEVSISKRQVQENKQFTETVSHEEARIEPEGDVDIRTNTPKNRPNQ